MKINKNKKTLNSFIKYCKAHPETRFWQALRNWKKVNFIYISKENIPTTDENLVDTYYFKNNE